MRNRYAGVNYKDCLAILGKAKVIDGFPRVAGIESVGEVVESSDNRFTPGQAVMVHGFQTGIQFDGGFSEYLRVPAAHLMPLPKGLDPLQAAMIGVPGFTVALALDRFQTLGITPEHGPIAVSGATGAVGMLAVLIGSGAGYDVHAITRRVDDPAFTHAGCDGSDKCPYRDGSHATYRTDPLCGGHRQRFGARSVLVATDTKAFRCARFQ